MLVKGAPGEEHTQIARFMGPTWGTPGSCRPQMGPILAPWTLLSGYAHLKWVIIAPVACCLLGASPWLQCLLIVSWTFGNSKIWNKIHVQWSSFNKVHLNMSSAKRCPFCSGLTMLIMRLFWPSSPVHTLGLTSSNGRAPHKAIIEYINHKNLCRYANEF